MLGLIDGDIVVYRASAKHETRGVDLGDGLGDAPIYDVGRTFLSASDMIRDWLRKARCDRALVCFSSVGPTFRHRIAGTYKANRKDAVRPAALMEVRALIAHEWKTSVIEGLEADDVMGIAMTSARHPCTIISLDKDMMTIPGHVFNPDKHRRPIRVSPADADRSWMLQTMTGDPVDGVKGIPGIGPVKAAAILENPRRLVPKTGRAKKTAWREGDPCSLWEAMVDRALAAGMSEADLVLQAQLTRILRSTDYDAERRVVKLWTPTGQKDLPL